MKLSNGKSFSLNFLARLVIVAKKWLHIPVTFGEVAEANGEGPCQRCVGRAIALPPADTPL